MKEKLKKFRVTVEIRETVDVRVEAENVWAAEEKATKLAKKRGVKRKFASSECYTEEIE